METISSSTELLQLNKPNICPKQAKSNLPLHRTLFSEAVATSFSNLLWKKSFATGTDRFDQTDNETFEVENSNEFEEVNIEVQD